MSKSKLPLQLLVLFFTLTSSVSDAFEVETPEDLNLDVLGLKVIPVSDEIKKFVKEYLTYEFGYPKPNFPIQAFGILEGGEKQNSPVLATLIINKCEQAKTENSKKPLSVLIAEILKVGGRAEVVQPVIKLSKELWTPKPKLGFFRPLSLGLSLVDYSQLTTSSEIGCYTVATENFLVKKTTVTIITYAKSKSINTNIDHFNNYRAKWFQPEIVEKAPLIQNALATVLAQYILRTTVFQKGDTPPHIQTTEDKRPEISHGSTEYTLINIEVSKCNNPVQAATLKLDKYFTVAQMKSFTTEKLQQSLQNPELSYGSFYVLMTSSVVSIGVAQNDQGAVVTFVLIPDMKVQKVLEGYHFLTQCVYKNWDESPSIEVDTTFYSEDLATQISATTEDNQESGGVLGWIDLTAVYYSWEPNTTKSRKELMSEFFSKWRNNGLCDLPPNPNLSLETPPVTSTPGIPFPALSALLTQDLTRIGFGFASNSLVVTFSHLSSPFGTEKEFVRQFVNEARKTFKERPLPEVTLFQEMLKDVDAILEEIPSEEGRTLVKFGVFKTHVDYTTTLWTFPVPKDQQFDLTFLKGCLYEIQNQILSLSTPSLPNGEEPRITGFDKSKAQFRPITVSSTCNSASYSQLVTIRTEFGFWYNYNYQTGLCSMALFTEDENLKFRIFKDVTDAITLTRAHPLYFQSPLHYQPNNAQTMLNQLAGFETSKSTKGSVFNDNSQFAFYRRPVSPGNLDRLLTEDEKGSIVVEAVEHFALVQTTTNPLAGLNSNLIQVDTKTVSVKDNGRFAHEQLFGPNTKSMNFWVAQQESMVTVVFSIQSLLPSVYPEVVSRVQGLFPKEASAALQFALQTMASGALPDIQDSSAFSGYAEGDGVQAAIFTGVEVSPAALQLQLDLISNKLAHDADTADTNADEFISAPAETSPGVKLIRGFDQKFLNVVRLLEELVNIVV